MLEVAPAYLSDTADVLALLCEEIGEPLDHGLAARCSWSWWWSPDCSRWVS
ncbi:hypothetical protein ACFQ2K_05240 [Streptomyces sanglieri]|uniref:Uncharacterized protein n=1 Tax=Streptomyces sanglieri TaxID=193460 RepID=A0ABW2WQQ4_9ACTN